MQKTFNKYTIIIITIAISVILFINFLFHLNLLKTQQFNTFFAKTEQMIHTLENNRMELDLLRKNLDEDYLTRARAAAYVLDRQKDVSMDVAQMQYLADLLNVDELHIINENGIIASSSVSQYVGIDMADHKQTRPFLDLLGGDSEEAYLIFSKFPTDIDEELFVVDISTQTVLGHSAGLHKDLNADCYRLDSLLDCEKGAYREGTDGTVMYVVSRRYDDVLLCAALPRSVLFQKLWKNMTATFFYLLFIETVIVFLLNYLIKRKVINGIHSIIGTLDSITKGNLDVEADVSGNREFEILSTGINAMVKSIVNLSDRISAIIEMSGIPLAAFEYERSINRVFVTSGLSRLLGLSEKEAALLYQNAATFDNYIRSVTRNPMKGEENIYRFAQDKYLQIYLSESSDGYLGVITDVTKDIRQKTMLHYENTHDPLTGLYKFDYFKEISAEILRKANPEKLSAVAMIDLDYFKSINDTYGHDAGDRYLQAFADVMKSMPVEHFLYARRSGDEFCMLLYDCVDSAEVLSCLNAFYEALHKKEVLLSDTQSKTISASCGFVLTDNIENSITELLRRADEALYEVKRNTKGVYGEYYKECRHSTNSFGFSI